MAAFPPSITPFATKENSNPALADPFQHSIPRTLPTEAELPMSLSKVVPVPPNKNNNTPRSSRTPIAAIRRPQCTHMMMIRLRGEHRCHNCGKVPTIGFVYSCQQDRFLQYSHFVPDAESLPVVPDNGNYFEVQAQVADSLGMSKSVARQMRDGEYSYDQIEILLQQRRHVLDVIRKSESTSTQSSSPPSPRKDSFKIEPSEVVIASSGTVGASAVQPATGTDLPMSPAGTPSNTPSISTATTPTRNGKQSKKMTCNFQICHTCRPFFTDRLNMSFDAIMNDEIPPISEEDSRQMRVLDARLVSNFGLRPSPQKQYPVLTAGDDSDSLAHMNQGDGYDDEDISPGCTPTDTTASNDSRFFRRSRELLPCPGQGFCPLWSETEGCAYDSGFDDGRRGINHSVRMDDTFDPEALEMAYNEARHTRMTTASTPEGTSSTGSSISLPEPKIEPLTPTTPNDPPFGLDLHNRLSKVGKAATVCGVPRKDSEYSDSQIHDKDSNSSVGSEVEVEGGVALTEEAVESGVPDIVTSD